MKTRIITALVAIAGIFPFFWFSEPVGLNNPLHYMFPLLISAIAFVSVFELLRCVGLDKNYFLAIPLYLAALAFPMLARVMYAAREDFIRVAILAVLVFAVYFFCILVFTYGKDPESTPEKEQLQTGKIALVFMTSVYIIGAYSAVILLRNVPKNGKFLYLIPFVFGWVTDTFAYFTGRLFGKHKLIPAVSPKKTVEGAIGGAVCCALVTILYGLLANVWFGAAPNYVVLAVSGLIIAVVSQIGDFAMSAIKRQYGIKDYGGILPGHGGLLDRFDSCMAVTIVLTLINTYFPLFA
ncbi:MAG: phosphatidate cytidylyltransferase [Ruminococcaceae bacterium]|nr:phosphatidate cytidylyltransferase [Oscillospiraceae bacterium]